MNALIGFLHDLVHAVHASLSLLPAFRPRFTRYWVLVSVYTYMLRGGSTDATATP